MSHQRNNQDMFFFKAKTIIAFVMISCGVYNSAIAGDVLHLQSGSTSIQKLKNESMALQNQFFSHTSSSVDFTEQKIFSIIQFKTSPNADAQNTLTKFNLRIVRYIPDDAYVVESTSRQLRKFETTHSLGVDAIVGISPYQAPVKMSPSFNMRNVFNRRELADMQVLTFAGADIARIENQLMQKGIVVKDVGRNVLLVRTSLENVEKIASIEGVEWISKKSKMIKMDFQPSLGASPISPWMGDVGALKDLTGYESGTKIMNFSHAWSKGLTGTGQMVAVADTGLDSGDKNTVVADFTHLHSGYVWGYGSVSWSDPDGHGTHVMGSVSGNGELSGGVVRGGAYETKPIIQSLWSAMVGELTPPNELRQLFSQAYEQGARIHSNSWGNPSAVGEYDSEAFQVDQFMWENPDMLILFAAGNSGIDKDKDGRVDESSLCSPATAKNVLSVGASENLVTRGGIQRLLGEIELPEVGKPWPVEPLASDKLSNNVNGIVAFSSRGPTKDKRIKPDVVAPGSNILSNCSSAPGAGELWGRFNKEYCFSGGTSMSTPLTAGASAVIRQYLISQGHEAPSAALIKAALMNSAAELFPGQFGEIGAEKGQELLAKAPNVDEGYGRVDVGQAVTGQKVYVDEKVGVTAGAEKSISYLGSKFKVTLVYTDAPGSPAASQALVNDLDLEIRKNGTIIAKSESRLDNSEQVQIDGLQDMSRNEYQVIVRAHRLAMGNKDNAQPYALIISE